MNADYIAELRSAAEQAGILEEEFRREVAERTRELERGRAFAFRRLNFMRDIAEVVKTATDEEEAVAAAGAAMRSKFGWSSDSEARSDVMTNFSPVARLAFLNHATPTELPEGPSVVGALCTFESWYCATHPAPFWALFDYEMPETPVVDF
jgi:hypothetical protein